MQEVFTIPLSKLNGWLFSINPNKVKPEVKAKLIEYKNECFDVLYKHFNKTTQPQHPTHQNNPYIYNLERENVELKRAINRLTYNQEKQENCINTTKFSEIMNKVQTKLYNQADEAIVLAHKELTDMLYKNKPLLN